MGTCGCKQGPTDTEQVIITTNQNKTHTTENKNDKEVLKHLSVLKTNTT